jgi:hypothetical protein
MKISEGSHLNEKAWIVENELIRVKVLPRIGAKIASLEYLPQAFETLSQPSNGRYSTPVFGASFAEFDTSGADEMFPTIDPCVLPDGVSLPDHGELWPLPWDVSPAGESLTCAVEGRVLFYRFVRNLSLDGANVILDYRIANLDERDLYGLWAFHGLIACDELSVVELRGIDRVLNVHDNPEYGRPGTILPFPGGDKRIDAVNSRDARSTRKFYCDGVYNAGAASITLNRGRLRYELSWDASKIPYLGVWINEGGFKDEYNAALEPSNGFYDSPEKALKFGALKPVPPGGELNWRLTITLLK